jgi:ribonuclease P protein component
MSPTPNSMLRLRKHADYQRVYTSSKKQFSKQMTFFYSLRPAIGPDGKVRRSDTAGPRIGLTVGKVMGKAVDRNRIKRRMRECIRRSAGLITAPVDVILHPRRVVIELEFAKLEREVALVFRSIQAAIDKEVATATKVVAAGAKTAKTTSGSVKTQGTSRLP